MLDATQKEVALWYLPLVRRLAKRYAFYSDAEFDDLVQEGCLAVCISLDRGVNPTEGYIRYAMRDWINLERRHGISGVLSKQEVRDIEFTPWHFLTDEPDPNTINDPETIKEL